MPLPENRTLSDTPETHLDDHNDIGAVINALQDGATDLPIPETGDAGKAAVVNETEDGYVLVSGGTDLTYYEGAGVGIAATGPDGVVLAAIDEDGSGISLTSAAAVAVSSTGETEGDGIQIASATGVSINAADSVILGRGDSETALELNPTGVGLYSGAADGTVNISASGTGGAVSVTADAGVTLGAGGLLTLGGTLGVAIAGDTVQFMQTTAPTIDSASGTLAADLAAVLIAMGLLAEAP